MMRTLMILFVAGLSLLAGCATQEADEGVTTTAAKPAAEPAVPSEAKEGVEEALNKGDAVALAAAIARARETGSSGELPSLLVRGLGNANDDVRETCSEQLVMLAPDSQQVIVALMEEGLQDEDPVVRQHAAEALGQIGPPAKEAVAALDQLQRNETETDTVRQAASLALEQINKVPESPADVK